MTILDLATIGLVMGILALGLSLAWLLWRETWRALNVAALTLGCALLAYGHLQWAGRHESETVKEALFIRQVVAGWALVGMGFVGLQRGRDHDRKE
jgi:hypothetical protein